MTMEFLPIYLDVSQICKSEPTTFRNIGSSEMHITYIRKG